MMVDFKFDALYSRKVNRKFVLVGGAVCANRTGSTL